MVDRLYSDARLAAVYERLYPPSPRELDFYLPLIMAAPAVLDVGCGTGTLLHAARRAGHRGRLCGLDPAEGMLAQARRQPDIEWVRGDLAAGDWVSEFDLVVMTGHAFQVLLGDEDLRISLATIRRALKAEGRFAFETRNPASRPWNRWSPDRATEIIDEQGEAIRVTLRIEAPFDGRTLTFTETFTSPGWEQPQVSRSTLRFLDRHALSGFLAAAGLLIEEQFGDWERHPLESESPEIITLARPAPR